MGVLPEAVQDIKLYKGVQYGTARRYQHAGKAEKESQTQVELCYSLFGTLILSIDNRRYWSC